MKNRDRNRSRPRVPASAPPKVLPREDLARVQGGVIERDDQLTSSYADWPTLLG